MVGYIPVVAKVCNSRIRHQLKKSLSVGCCRRWCDAHFEISDSTPITRKGFNLPRYSEHVVLWLSLYVSVNDVLFSRLERVVVINRISTRAEGKGSDGECAYSAYDRTSHVGVTSLQDDNLPSSYVSSKSKDEVFVFCRTAQPREIGCEGARARHLRSRRRMDDFAITAQDEAVHARGADT